MRFKQGEKARQQARVAAVGSERAEARRRFPDRSIRELELLRRRTLAALAKMPDPVPPRVPFRRRIQRERRELVKDLQAAEAALARLLTVPTAMLSGEQSSALLAAAQRRRRLGDVVPIATGTTSPYAADTAIEQLWRNDR